MSLKRYWVEARGGATQLGARVALSPTELCSRVTIHPSVSTADAWPLRFFELKADPDVLPSTRVAHHRVERMIGFEELLGPSQPSVDRWFTDLANPRYFRVGPVGATRAECETLIHEHARRLQVGRGVGRLSVAWVDSWRKVADWRRRPLASGGYCHALGDEREALLRLEAPRASFAHALRVHAVCLLLHTRGVALLRRALFDAALTLELGAFSGAHAPCLGYRLTEIIEPILDPLNLWLLAAIARSSPGTSFMTKSCRTFLQDLHLAGPELFAALPVHEANAASSLILEVATNWLAVTLPMCELIADQTAAIAFRPRVSADVWEPLTHVLESGVTPLRVLSENTLGLFAPAQH